MAPLRSHLLVLLPILALASGCGRAPATTSYAAGGLAARSFPSIGVPEDDQRIPPGYYQEAAGKEGPALLAALHRIVAPHRDLGYDAARDVLFGQIADLDGDDRVADLYTGEIREGIRNRATAYAKGMNTEHTWPQSLGAQGAAQTDLHHLHPEDIKINGTRGSYPYGKVSGKPIATFPGPDGASRMGHSSEGLLVFEPRPSVRGDIARGLLYFYTTYAVEGGAGAPRPDLRNFRLESAVLPDWIREDPVDAGERARNEAIFRAQGNRNPYVDRPEWAREIDLLPD